MTTEFGLSAVVGRFKIRAVDRPPVWPFLRDAVLEVSPSGDASAALVRVFTTGGALLRSYPARLHAGRLRLPGIEGHGCQYDLLLSTRLDEVSRPLLAGRFERSDGSTAGPAAFDGGWIADVVDRPATWHAA